MHARVAAPRDGDAERHVVLVHGVGVSSAYFVPLLEELGKVVVTWAPDLPGHGLTPARGQALDFDELCSSLETWLDELQIGPAKLVGNSLGGQLVADLATRRPDLVSALVLLGPTTEQRARSIPRHAVRLMLDAIREPPRLLALVAREYLLSGPRRVLREFVGGRDRDLRESLRCVEHPIALARGSRDPISTDEWLEDVEASVPTARRTTIDGAAHAAHWTHPQLVASLVADGDTSSR